MTGSRARGDSNPFRAGRQPFAYPTSECIRFIPTHARHRAVFGATYKLAIGPEPGARLAGTIHKFGNSRPYLCFPDSLLRIATVRYKITELHVCDRKTV